MLLNGSWHQHSADLFVIKFVEQELRGVRILIPSLPWIIHFDCNSLPSCRESLPNGGFSLDLSIEANTFVCISFVFRRKCKRDLVLLDSDFWHSRLFYDKMYIKCYWLIFALLHISKWKYILGSCHTSVLLACLLSLTLEPVVHEETRQFF